MRERERKRERELAACKVPTVSEGVKGQPVGMMVNQWCLFCIYMYVCAMDYYQPLMYLQLYVHQRAFVIRENSTEHVDSNALCFVLSHDLTL